MKEENVMIEGAAAVLAHEAEKQKKQKKVPEGSVGAPPRPIPQATPHRGGSRAAVGQDFVRSAVRHVEQVAHKYAGDEGQGAGMPTPKPKPGKKKKKKKGTIGKKIKRGKMGG